MPGEAIICRGKINSVVDDKGRRKPSSANEVNFENIGPKVKHWCKEDLKYKEPTLTAKDKKPIKMGREVIGKNDD